MAGNKNILEDSRFAHLVNDPRYRNVSKAERKVKIDKRFQSMFKDDKFKVKYTIDKRGRPINKSSTEDLKKYYELSSESSDSEEEDELEKSSDESEGEPGSFVRAAKTSDVEEDENDELEEDENLPDKIKMRLKDLDVDYARGEYNILSDSSSGEEDSDSEDEVLKLEHCWGELDRDAPATDESTNRLAACNMDWDRIRASDIMVLCNSFLPTGGVIHKVTIYPSEYGTQRMKEEDEKGPIELTEAKVEEYNDKNRDEENADGSSFHMERLRQYQLNRLKYYYAVIECDSVATADKLYAECDGLEYESSATKLDLRFIPDDVTFDEKPREECTELPELNKYQPRQFTTTALQQAKVELTWDETCPERKEISSKLMSGKIDDVTSADLREYLASSSSEEENEGFSAGESYISREKTTVNGGSEEEDNRNKLKKGNSLDKYKALLQDIKTNETNKKNKGMEMEVIWGMGLKEKTEKLVKEKMKNEGETELTPFEKYVEKRKEKKKAKREERRKKFEGNNSDSDVSEEDIPDGIDMNDPYFAEEFENGDYDKPKSKKKNTEKKKGKQVKDSEDESDEKNKRELELLLLDEKDDGKAHFSLKKILDAENETKSKCKRRKKQLKKKKEAAADVNAIDFEVDTTDNRFSALYTSHHFNIDPTDSHYKKTKGMDKLIKEKLKRRSEEQTNPDDDTERISKKPRKDIGVNMLVKNIKRKSKNIV